VQKEAHRELKTKFKQSLKQTEEAREAFKKAWKDVGTLQKQADEVGQGTCTSKVATSRQLKSFGA
jgi:hypothetical protein